MLSCSVQQARARVLQIDEADRSYLLRKPGVGLITAAFSMRLMVPIGRCVCANILAHAYIFSANGQGRSIILPNGTRVRARKLGASHEYLFVLTVAQLEMEHVRLHHAWTRFGTAQLLQMAAAERSSSSLERQWRSSFRTSGLQGIDVFIGFRLHSTWTLYDSFSALRKLFKKPEWFSLFACAARYPSVRNVVAYAFVRRRYVEYLSKCSQTSCQFL